MARAHVSTVRTTAAPTATGGMGRWIVGIVAAVALAAAAYWVFAGSAYRYNAPTGPSYAPSAAPATLAPGVPAPQVTAPQMTSAPAPPRYP